MNEDKIIGLTNKEVLINRQNYGSNKLISRKKDSFLNLFLQSLSDPIIRILLIALGIKTVFLMKNFDWYETVGIVIAIFLASFISTVSEYGSEKAFEKLQEESSKTKSRVKRNGVIVEILSEEVVKNDIVLLNQGDLIPADGIIIKGEVTVDESSLNGESKEKLKTPKSGFLKEENKVFKGTVVYDKEAYMLVDSVGENTMYGKLALELQEKQPESPLKKRLRDLAKIISRIGYIGSILVFFSFLFSQVVIKNNFDAELIKTTITNVPLITGYLLHGLTLAVTIIVVSVPEGLPMMITLVLSSNMKRMLKNNVLVRKLMGIETAGNINILFTDKTGTLTKGKLEVTKFIDGNLNFYDEKTLYKYPKLYEKVYLNCIYNNESILNEENMIIGGNTTDRAIRKYIKNKLHYNIKVIDKKTFNSKDKYSTTSIIKESKINLIKGAPEILLKKCNYYYDKVGNKIPLKKNKIEELIKLETEKGNRVLLLGEYAYYEATPNTITLIGLVIIKDEIRKEAIEGLKLVKSANIHTIMVTGDNKNTAISIGKEIGLYQETDLVFTSDEIKNKTDFELKKLLPKIKIIARALPSDKSRLVRISQELDLVVGMTGDGVNDTPALKRADVGFAMGSGSEVAKEAGDIVILDDNFLSISNAILYGRTIFKSIRKFIIFQLTVNLCAVILSVVGPFIGINTPVTVIQMLWINMVMDTLAGLAFSFEPALKEYMEEKPLPKNASIINKYMLHEIIFTGFYSVMLCFVFLKLPYFQTYFRAGENDLYLMTAFFGLFIFMGIFNCFNARTHRLNLLAHLTKNKVFLIVILFIIVVQLYLLYFGGEIFRTAGLTIKEFYMMILLSLTVIPVDWLRKFYLRKKGIKGGV